MYLTWYLKQANLTILTRSRHHHLTRLIGGHGVWIDFLAPSKLLTCVWILRDLCTSGSQKEERHSHQHELHRHPANK